MNGGKGLDAVRFAFNKCGVTFSKETASKLVGGRYRLEKLVYEGKIRMYKPTEKQNGKWFCIAGDVLNYMKL